MPALGERSLRGMGAEWYFVPAIMPWAGRGVMGQWRHAVSIGEALAAARGQAGLTITQVSQRTRIRETLIGGIERDDFSGCGGDFYARGHIRAIARAVGADGEPLVGEYDASHGTPQASTAAGLPGPPAPLRLRKRRGPHWSVALLAVLAAAAGLVTYHLMASGPAGRVPAAARTPAVSLHKAARRHPAATNTPAPPAARHLVRSLGGRCDLRMAMLRTALQSAVREVAALLEDGQGGEAGHDGVLADVKVSRPAGVGRVALV